MRDEVLYHFVGYGQPTNDAANFETLCKILVSEQVGRYPDDDPTAGIRLTIDPSKSPKKGELIQQSITCFCDIPFDDLSIHVSKYGRFGVGVSRRVLCTFGARPVAYIPIPRSRPDAWGHTLASDLRALVVGIQEHLRDKDGRKRDRTRHLGRRLSSPGQVVDVMESTIKSELLAFAKFFDSDLPADHIENYYMEREWRKFLPLPLQTALEEIVVPLSFADRLTARFPQHKDKVRILPVDQ